MFKRIFSFVTAAAVSFAAMNVQYLSVEALASADVNVLEPVYFMDFNPDADGKFYDSPAGTEGRAEVPRMDNPSGIKLVQYAANTDDMIIKKTGNAGMLVPTAETNSVYTAFSDKSVSGTIGDTSLKTAHLNGVSTVASAELKFPKAYGGTDDTYKKYRFEADWMYHSTNTTDFQYGIIILNLVIGGKAMRLETKSTSGSNDVRDGYPLAFYSPTSDFNITYRNTDTLEADKDGITKSADGIKTEMDGEWIHITIDIDFTGRKLYAKLENKNKNFVREFIGEDIQANESAFDTGLQSVKLNGNKKTVSYVNFFDNVKITPIEKKDISDITKANNTATVNITAGAGFDKPLSLFAAEYEADGTLKSVKKSEAKEFGAGTKGSITVSTEGMVEDNTRFFLWDSALKPVKTYTSAESASESE